MFIAYLKDMYQPIQNIAQNLKELSSSRAGLDRVFVVLDVQPDIRDAPDAHPLPPVRGEIRLERVTFGYREGQPVLRNIDLRVAPGEKIALVGRTGAGKSTLASLILRFFDPQAGRVLVDGHDLRKVTLRSLRRQITLMLQEPILFRTTVYENIACSARGTSPWRRSGRRRGRPKQSGSSSSCRRATAPSWPGWPRPLRRATAAPGAGPRPPSGDAGPGPRRADELPRRGDRGRRLANVAEMLRGRTAIIIAHRLSTARIADRIAVMDGGSIVELGSHEELLARRGRYRGLWERTARLHEGLPDAAFTETA